MRSLLLGLAIVRICVAQSALSTADPGGVLNEFVIASLSGHGSTAISVITTDAKGNIYVAGTTNAVDLPVKNAAQPQIGDSAVMASVDGGVTWEKLGNPPVSYAVIEVDLSSPQVLFIGGYEGLFKSTDGGQSWVNVNITLKGLTYQLDWVTSVAIDPTDPRHIAVLTGSGVVVTFDGGETWTLGAGILCYPCGFPRVDRLWMDPLGSGTLLAKAGDGLYISHDGGATFTSVTLRTSPRAVAFDPLHPGWIYLTASSSSSNDGEGHLFLSSDGGSTWEEKSNPGSTEIRGLLADPEEVNTLYAVNSSGDLFKSGDGAATWTRLQPPDLDKINGQARLAIVSRQCGPAGGLFVITQSGAIVSSSDFGGTWGDPQLGGGFDISPGPGCTIYASKTIVSDGFVAKFAPDGSQIWTTFLGGSGADVVSGMALELDGNVYVTGATRSGDFPATSPLNGQRGLVDAFLTEFDPDGKLVYSAVIGGGDYFHTTIATAIAVDPQGGAHVVGTSSSTTFPATPGAFDTQFGANNRGFIAKFRPDGTLQYASYLGTSDIPAAVAVDASGQALVAGAGARAGFILRIDPSGSRVTAAVDLKRGTSAGAIATDRQGDVYVLGTTSATDFPTIGGGYVSRLHLGGCSSRSPSSAAGDIYVMKLHGPNLDPVYAARMGSGCSDRPGALAVDGEGAVTLSVFAGPSFPLRKPLLGGSVCGAGPVVSRLSADGTRLVSSTYLDMCGVPAIASGSSPFGSSPATIGGTLAGFPPVAVGTDGSVYTGITRDATTGILRLPPSSSSTVSIDQIGNAFSGEGSAVVPGSLVWISTTTPGSEVFDLGLNAPKALPYELGGTRVLFDGVAAPLLRVGNEEVVAVAPEGLKQWTTVQLSHRGILSNSVIMPVWPWAPGLLRRDFPAFLPGDNLPDGNVRNQDGTLNDEQHPAPAGSTITLFATGLGPTNPPVAPGSIAATDTVRPAFSVYNSWNGRPEAVASVPGFVSAMFQIRVRVPYISSPGTVRLPVWLSNAPLGSRYASRFSSAVGVYVRQ